jgi:uncharacterized YigZ family protein
MMDEDQYLTIAGTSEGIFKEKGSKFIAIAVPVHSVEQARSELESIRKKYHDARHHCYAYKIGRDDEAEYRYNDDGEPSGTAGKPIYGQIESFGLSHILIVVIRYFGGIKLGTGGLIQAYKAAARDALENAKIITRTRYAPLTIMFPYPAMNDIMRCIKEEDLDIRDQEFTLEGKITLNIRLGRYEMTKERFLSIEGVTIIE